MPWNKNGYFSYYTFKWNGYIGSCILTRRGWRWDDITFLIIIHSFAQSCTTFMRITFVLSRALPAVPPVATGREYARLVCVVCDKRRVQPDKIQNTREKSRSCFSSAPTSQVFRNDSSAAADSHVLLICFPALIHAASEGLSPSTSSSSSRSYRLPIRALKHSGFFLVSRANSVSDSEAFFFFFLTLSWIGRNRDFWINSRIITEKNPSSAVGFDFIRISCFIKNNSN